MATRRRSTGVSAWLLFSLIVATAFATLGRPAYAGNNTWTQLGPAGGRTDKVAVDPADASRVYLHGFGAGLHKSDDAGQTFVPVTAAVADFDAASVTDFAVDPIAPDTLYMADNDMRVMRSTDRGVSWQSFSTGLTVNIYYIYTSATTAGTVYATASGGDLFKSVDNGENWVAASSGMSMTVISDVFSHPSDAAIVFAVGWEGVFRSIDGAATWTEVTAGLPPANGSGYRFVNFGAIDPVNPDIMYVQISNQGVYRSVDGGDSWTSSSVGLGPDFYTGFVIDPTDTNRIYLGSGNNDVIVTTNGGANWGPLANNGLGNYTINSLAMAPNDPTRLYGASSQRGLYVTTDGGTNWTTTGAGFVNTTIQSVGYDGIGDTLLAGTGSGMAYSPDLGATWTLNTGDYDLATYAIVADPLVADRYFAGSSCCGVYESLDGGVTWTRINLGLPVVATWVTDIDIPESQPLTLYFSDFNRGLFKTDDGGTTWVDLNPGLVPLFGGGFVRLSAVDSSADNPSIVYTGSSDFADGGVFRSDDGGTTWVRKSGSGMPGPSRADTIVVHPTNPDSTLR